MSVEAPERIWAASVTDSYGEWQTVKDGLPRPVEYVRADLYAALEAQLAEARKALDLFEHYGCPICHGDCASANPPVYCCPMQAASRVRKGG